MRAFIAFDTETALIADDDPNPPLVCLSWYAPGASRVAGVADAGLVKHDQAADVFVALAVYALITRTTIIAHNLAFDLAVLLRRWPALTALVFHLLDEGLLECTLIRETLHSIATGTFTSDDGQKGRWINGKFQGFGLDDCCRVRRDWHVAKDDTWRLRYGELLDVPLEAWPEAARKYAVDDAEWVWKLAQAQEDDEAAQPVWPGQYVFADAARQARGDFPLELQRVKGVQTDRVLTEQVIASTEKRLDAERDLLTLGSTPVLRPAKWRPIKKEWGKITVDQSVVRAKVTAAYQTLGIDLPMTPKGDKVSIDKKALAIAGAVDDDLLKFARYQKADKIRGFTRILQRGFEHPIHSDPNVLVETGRTSWQRPNLQQLPREEGVRECFVPSPGMLFFSIDYSQLELRTLAQACIWLLGHSKMAELINAGVDLHTHLAANFVGVSYESMKARVDEEEPAAVAFRQFSKEANFGFPGGMGIDKFIERVLVTDEKKRLTHLLNHSAVRRLRDTWMATFPEIRPYFDIASRVDRGERRIVQLASGRIRGSVGYCDSANGRFQSLAADGAKDALYCITRAMWAEPSSPAFGSWLWCFAHDEFLGEAPVETAHEVVHAVYDIAMSRMRAWLPDLKVTGSMCLMRRWRKKAKAYFVNGRLYPVEDSPDFKGL